MQTKVFTARKNLIDKTLHGKPCIDAYREVYNNELASKFDPISSEISSRAMCAEFVKEINTLLDMSKSSLVNATRYSYLITQQVDLETQQVDTYSECVGKETEADFRNKCLATVTKPGMFDLFNSDDKANVCLTATHTWDDMKAASNASGGTPHDVCAILTTHIF